MEEISEQVQGLEVSQALELDYFEDPRPVDSSPHVPSLTQVERLEASQLDTHPQHSDPVTADTVPSPSTIGDRQASPDDYSNVPAPSVLDIGTRQVLEENDIHFSNIASAFLEAVEIQARAKRQLGGDNILVYQRLSELAEAHMLEDRLELYVALCSLMVTGYKKFLGPKAWGTLMTIEILADALQRMGKDEESSVLYQQAIQGYEDILTLSCQDVCKASGPHTHELPSASYQFRVLNQVWCQREECGHGIGRHSRKNSESRKGLNYTQPLCQLEQAKRRTVNILQCLLVKYLAFELREGATQSYNETADLPSHLRSLYEKAKTVTVENVEDTSQKSPPWAAQHWAILDLFEEKKKCKCNARFKSIVARQAMEITTRYPSSCEILNMLFYLVLAWFEAPEPLPPEWNSWKATFYGLHAARFDHRGDRSAEHMLTAIGTFIKTGGIDGLSNPLAQYVSEELFQYRTQLEEDREFFAAEEQPKVEEVMAYRRKKLLRINDLIAKITQLETFVAANVSPDKVCALCFGNCVCEGYHLPDQDDIEILPALYRPGLETMEYWDHLDRLQLESLYGRRR